MNATAQKNQIARINRQLAKQGRKLKTSRSWGEKSNLGDHYVIDIYTNTVMDTHVELDLLEKEVRSAAS